VRDAYEVLGIKRGASLDEIKAAYRRASKERHPDLGGTNEAMVELNTAYAFILNELKQGYQQQQKEEPKRQQSADAGDGAWQNVNEDASYDARRDTYWRNIYRDIDDELETLRRAAEQYDEQLRTMRRAAWQTGHHAAWAKLTWDDFFGFLTRTARSGVKGLALLFAALVGIGSVLVEANFVSALILLGSALGFAFSLTMKSDKGGMLSTALLLFGVMTIWLPPIRGALVLYPLATISVLILLALIFKFAQAGGTVGLLTGGVLALYVIGVIVGDTSRQPTSVAVLPPQTTPAILPATRPIDAPRPTSAPLATPSPPHPAQQVIPTPSAPQPTAAPIPPEPRTLLAAQGAILKFVAGVPYHLKVRTGLTTSLRATQGKVALGSLDGGGECVDAFEFPYQSGAGPWREIDRTFRACGEDAVMAVISVQ
jgi:hypothetical protein